MSERTLSIIKPDAVGTNVCGHINAMIETAGLFIIAQRRELLVPAAVRVFYQEHAKRPFFESLISYMTSGPVVLQVLKGNEAISRYRTLMGATDPREAKPGTIRALYGASIEANAVHGSDSQETALREVPFFFAGFQLI